jgi:hypothetical protein
MSNKRYSQLCERIIAHCREKHWYGPDTYPPSDSRGNFTYEDGTFAVHQPLHELRIGFAFPPATEEQLRKTEEVMGFSHPPLLRALYLQIANGGFGPGTGILGAFGGYLTDLRNDPRYNHTTKARLLRNYGENFCLRSYPYLFNSTPFDLEQHEKKYGNPRLIRLSKSEWPTFFLQLCTWWYEAAFYLHVPTGHVYFGTAGDGGVFINGEENFTNLYRNADSLEEWWERWCEGGTDALYRFSPSAKQGISGKGQEGD